MTHTDPPSTEKSAQMANPLLTERRRAERAEAEAMALRVQLRSLRPSADRPPLSRRVVEAVQATPRVMQWAALLTALAGLLGAAAALARVALELVK